MAKNVLVISASMRANSNSDMLAAAFADGAQLIDYLRTHIPDVVLTDIQMIDFFPGLFRLDGQRMEFAHGRGFTTVCVYGNLHTYLHRQLPDAPDFYILS
mgnify:CR=1 FL=1